MHITLPLATSYALRVITDIRDENPGGWTRPTQRDTWTTVNGDRLVRLGLAERRDNRSGLPSYRPTTDGIDWVRAYYAAPAATA